MFVGKDPVLLVVMRRVLSKLVNKCYGNSEHDSLEPNRIEEHTLKEGITIYEEHDTNTLQ